MNTPPSLRHLKIAGLLVLGVLALGTTGYMVIEQLPFVDALYTTVMMMTTLGNLVHPLNIAGRIFTIFMVIIGVGSLLYALSAGMEFMIEGHFSRVVRSYLMEKKITRLRGHTIICGFGRVGSQIAEDCAAVHKAFVVIDEREENIRACLQRGYLAIQSDATTDAGLRAAGIERAACLLVATDSDAHNISITLSARYLNSHLLIIARANHNETDAKLKRAGADRVLPLYTIGGHRMAHLALQPAIIDFFDVITQVENTELAAREVTLDVDLSLIGKTITEAQDMLEDGVVIAALKKKGGLLRGPRRETLIEKGDTLILVGVQEQLTNVQLQKSPASPPVQTPDLAEESHVSPPSF